jgi:hypothetical protein
MEKVSFNLSSLEDYDLRWPCFLAMDIPSPLAIWGDDRCVNMNDMPHTEEVITTGFTDDGPTETVMFREVPSEESYSQQHEDIRSFLAKPYLVADGLWLSTDAAGTQYYGASVAATMLTVSAWTNKISGFNLVRGTVVMRLQLNANPFFQGKLILHFLPNSTARGNDATYNFRLIQITQQPNVELDASESSCIMKVPYISPTYYYDIKNGIFDWGNFYITVLAQLNCSGTAPFKNVEWSLWMSFEDFELAAPSIPQAKFSTSVNAGEKEKEAYAKGSVSSALAKVASAASTLSAIPPLSAYMGSLSWVASALSASAAAFGYSKPISEESPVFISSQYNRYLANSDGLSTAVPLALSATNKVKTTDEMTIRNVDEMSFSFLKRVEALVATQTWTTSNVAADVIYPFTGLAPSTLFQTSILNNGTHTTTVNFGPPIWYLSNLFALSRGSLKLKIKFVKTVFHTGRLLLTWTPSYNTSVSAPSVYTSTLSLREIIDIRYCNEAEFELPYLLPFSYAENLQPYGYLSILVLNPLRAPETVSTQIQLLMYFSGGDDLEFQAPIHSHTSGALIVPVVVNSTPLVSKIIGDQKSTSLGTRFAEASVGEMFCSVKQLISRNVPFSRTADYPASSAINVYPYFWSSYHHTPSGPQTVGTYGYDLMSFIAPMYAFYKGGSTVNAAFQTSTSVVARILPVTSFTSSVIESGANTSAGVASYTWYSAASTGQSLNGAYYGDNVTVASFSVPYYAQTRFSTVVPSTSNTISGATAVGDAPIVGLYIYKAEDSNSWVPDSISRVANDDFQFGYFIGCPPLLITST